MKHFKLEYIREPVLKFAYGQDVTDPRDGLTIFGPYDKGKVADFSIGIIGTSEGIRKCKGWLNKLQKPIFHPTRDIAKPFFPGFESAFSTSMNLQSISTIEINEAGLENFYKYNDNRIRVAEIVDLYVEPLKEHLNESEQRPKIWFIIIPNKVYSLCRPKSMVPKKGAIKVGFADEYSKQMPGLFEDEQRTRWRTAYKYENHFHNQLKIKLLNEKIVTQIIREDTIAFDEKPNVTALKLKSYNEQLTAINWNLANTIYYKAGGVPWKVSKVRKNVCYIGLTFKRDDINIDSKIACCAAQMFLDSGDGVVFRGRVGPYYNPDTKEYHLSEERAYELLSKVLEAFKKDNREYPEKIFIHGKTFFNDEEWSGFERAVNEKSKVFGVRITHEKDFKLFRVGEYPIFRGAVHFKNHHAAFLWTKGFMPRIQSILGLETPNPLLIELIRGEEDIFQICKDVMMLTKLNYNACIYCDGTPVTLKFADLIGEILTAGPNEHLEVLPFMYYI
jgi:hypothetical protein